MAFRAAFGVSLASFKTAGASSFSSSSSMIFTSSSRTVCQQAARSSMSSYSMLNGSLNKNCTFGKSILFPRQWRGINSASFSTGHTGSGSTAEQKDADAKVVDEASTSSPSSSSSTLSSSAAEKAERLRVMTDSDMNLKDLLKREEFLVVKDKLIQEPRDQITFVEYIELCQSVGLDQDEALRLSQSLTDTGIIYHNPKATDPLVKNAIFLKPEKISSLLRAVFHEQKLFAGAQSIDEFDQLRENFKVLLVQKGKIDERAHKYANKWIVVLGVYLLVQVSVLARLTWWEYSWDIMEPITYFVTFSATLIGYVYYAVTKQEYTYESLRDTISRRRRHELYKREGFDYPRYKELEAIFGATISLPKN